MMMPSAASASQQQQPQQWRPPPGQGPHPPASPSFPPPPSTGGGGMPPPSTLQGPGTMMDGNAQYQPHLLRQTTNQSPPLPHQQATNGMPPPRSGAAASLSPPSGPPPAFSGMRSVGSASMNQAPPVAEMARLNLATQQHYPPPPLFPASQASSASSGNASVSSVPPTTSLHPRPSHPYYPAYRGSTESTTQSGVPSRHGSHDQHAAEALLHEAQQFNSFPHFVRPTTQFLPNSASVKQKCHLPIGISVQPLARTPPGYPEVPSVNFGNATVVRCKRCRTYVNPFVQWEANGRRWICNLCGYLNDTPQFYSRPLDEQGKREDRFERPELCMGSVEFIAPSDYMVRPPQPPTYMFVIDVSLGAVSSGLVDVAAAGIKKALVGGSLPGGSRSMVGIITYDTSIHFYNLNSRLSQPQMQVVSDLSDVFLPLPGDMLVNTADSLNVITSLLDNLSNMWRNSRASENCMGSAMKAAYMAMKPIGGKMCVFTSAMPTTGDFPLKTNREFSRQGTSGSGSNPTDREIEMLKPASDSYQALAEKLTQAQISVELFVCPLHFVDLATMSAVSKYSSGDVHYFPQFNAHAHGDKLREELHHILTRESGWEAVMRFRVSRGWKITSWYGHFFFRGVDLLVIPNCHADQTFSIALEMEENVVQDPLVYLQSALLYTNSDGERRIRVHTYCLPVTQNAHEITLSMDPQVVVSMMCLQALDLSLKSKLADGRNYIQTVCSQIVSTLSAVPTNQSSSSAQLAAAKADKARVFPLYALGLLKSVVLRDAKDVTADLRHYHWSRLETLPVEMQAAFFYPRMLSLHDMDLSYGTSDETLTSERMTQDGVYLLEDGESMMMWIGKGVRGEWMQGVFGVASLDHLHPDYAEQSIGTSGDPLGNRVAMILQTIRQERKPDYLKLQVIRQGDPAEHRFFSSLIEDRTQSLLLSFSEFLAKIGGGRGTGGTGGIIQAPPPLVTQAAAAGAPPPYGHSHAHANGARAY